MDYSVILVYSESDCPAGLQIIFFQFTTGKSLWFSFTSQKRADRLTGYANLPLDENVCASCTLLCSSNQNKALTVGE